MSFLRARAQAKAHQSSTASGARKALAVLASMLVVASVLVPTAANAALGDPGGLTVSKRVDDLAAQTVEPGDSFNYGIAVGCDDNPCINAKLMDELPSEFAGFTLGAISVFPSAPEDYSLTLTGGCTVGAPLVAGCSIDVAFLDDLGSLGAEPQVGIQDGKTFRISYELTSPVDLSPSWAHNGTAVPNVAEVSADNAATVTSTANVTVSIPVIVDVAVAKTWTPADVQFEPGAQTTITTTIRNTSNVDAASLVLQDPSMVTESAATLDESNPFTIVDFAGLCVDAVTFPQGADLVQVDLFALDTTLGVWNWVNGIPAATPTLPATTSEIGGVRMTFTSSTGATIIADGTGGEPCFTVAQRSTHRTSGESLVLGSSATNVAAGTVTVPGEEPVTRTSNAAMTVTGLDIEVTAGKQITPGKIPAGGDATVSIVARNDSNGPLTSLTIAEPAAGQTFLSGDIAFDGFESSTWPTGATAAAITWSFSDDSTSAPVSFGAAAAPALPVIPVGEHITGFSVTYTGSIIAGTTAGLSFAIATDSEMIHEDTPSTVFTNVVGAAGTNPAGTDSDTAAAPLEVFYPDIAIALEKQLHPSALVAPGGTVAATLMATTSAQSQYVNPTSIVIEDRLMPRGAGATPDFWDAHRIRSILFTDVPTGTTLTVEYTTDPASATPTWAMLDGGIPEGVYSRDIASPLADDITGLKFTFSNPSGFGQGTTVRPNLVFEAAATLRDGTTATDTVDPSDPQRSTRYDNRAFAHATGSAGSIVVTSDEVQDNAGIGVIVYPGDGTGPGGILAAKDWRQADGGANPRPVASQSGSTLRTLQHWGVTTPGYGTVVLTDSASPEAGPEATVYQAFDLTRILPVTFEVDPLLRWDVVSSVELYNATDGWIAVTPAGGSWMSSSGFTGYDLTAAQQAATTGVRITVAENGAVRAASTDPTRPEPGSGVASSAEGRALSFHWVLRNTLRVPGADVGDTWVKPSRGYNVPTSDGACGPLECGIVRNTFGVTAMPFGGTAVTRTAFDDIGLIDTLPNVQTRKAVVPTSVTVPHPGDVDPANYPTVSYTVEAWSTSSSRASYLRSADPMPCAAAAPDCLTDATDPTPDIYTGKNYDPATNPFERFTITDLAFTIPAGLSVDAAASQVALWKRAVDGALSVQLMSITAAQALGAVELADVVGVSVVYQSTDPELTGGLIPSQHAEADHLRFTISAQLRSTLRSAPTAHLSGGITVDNSTVAQSFDPVLAPSGAGSTPFAVTTAPLSLQAASLDVTASKSISPDTIVEPNPFVPLTVSLGATDGASTLAAEQLVIEDVDADFWATFELTSLVSTARPAGASLVRADVLLDGDPTWIEGPAGATASLAAVDLELVAGIRFVYFNADGSPFSNTVPSADWSAQAVFTVQHRANVAFAEGSLDNEMTAVASHKGYPEVSQARADVVLMSAGVPRLDVQKEPLTGNATHVVEPGEPVDWTLRFTNSGTSYLDLETLVDELGAYLEWDGGSPSFATSAGGTLPTAGIAVGQPTPTSILFTWPDEARMQPGESFVVTLSLSLLPGLTSGERATNEFMVTTGQTLVACTNTSGNGQGTLAGLGATECGTSNFVRPLAGALLFAQKSVKGEIDGTLVSGATNVVDPSLACTPDAEGFFRSVCAAHTVIGATDTWRLRVVNSGTVPYQNLTIVDVLPHIGDRMLATGSARGSEFRPVIANVAAPLSDTLPPGAVQSWEVTTDPLVCIGSGPTPTWGSDPVCSEATWVLGSTYTGDPEHITALRWSVDFTDTSDGSLLPGGTVEARFNTVNTPGVTTDSPSVEMPVGPQHAWNQFGVVATTTSDDQIRRAPTKTGVVTQVAELDLAKVVDGSAAEFAPSSFTVALQCTIDGVPVAMGDHAGIEIPANGRVSVRDLPLGAECAVVDEPRSGGAHAIDLGETVLLDSVDAAPLVTIRNTFTGGPLMIVKQRVGQGVERYGSGPFTIQVVCTWMPDGVSEDLPLHNGGEFQLSAANDFRVEVPLLPVGAWCEIVETDAGGASSTHMDPADGRIQIIEPALFVPGATVTITNHFNQMASTGLDGNLVFVWLGAGFLLIAVGGGVIVARRRPVG